MARSGRFATTREVYRGWLSWQLTFAIPTTMAVVENRLLAGLLDEAWALDKANGTVDHALTGDLARRLLAATA